MYHADPEYVILLDFFVAAFILNFPSQKCVHVLIFVYSICLYIKTSLSLLGGKFAVTIYKKACLFFNHLNIYLDICVYMLAQILLCTGDACHIYTSCAVILPMRFLSALYLLLLNK